MKQLLRFKTFLLLALLAMIGNSVWAAEETITFSKKGYSNAAEVTTVSGDVFSVTFAKGTNSSNAPKYYDTGTAIRAYGGNTFTVSSESTITKIVLTFASGEGTNEITASPESYSNGTWTGSATSVTFTIGGTSGHRRISSIAVTTEGATDSRTEAGIYYEVTFFTATIGETTTFPVLSNPNGLTTVSYESSDKSVATIDANNGEITLVGKGTTTITASFAGDETYKPAEVSYTLTVKEGRPSGALFYETFDQFAGTGGRDNSFTGSIASNKFEGTDETWTTSTSCNAAKQCAKFGTGSASGTMTSSSISLSGAGVLTFSAAGWGDTKSNSLKVTATGGTLSGDTDITLVNSVWNDYTVNISDAEGNLVLTFTGARGFIDDIVVTAATPDTKKDPELKFSEETVNGTYGEVFAAPKLTYATDGEISYKSSDTNVAEVDIETGVVTLIGAGSTVITASSAATDNYNAGSASYTLVVTDGRPATVASFDQATVSLDVTEASTFTGLKVVVKRVDNESVIDYESNEMVSDVWYKIDSDTKSVVSSINNLTGELSLTGNEGVALIKATYNYKNNLSFQSSEAYYNIEVLDKNAPGKTQENPYTVAQARAAIDANDGVTGVYAKGIVSGIVTAYNSTFGNISYNISEDGSTTADQLQAYRGKSYAGANFTSADDIQVGDEVVIYGNLKKYNSTYEFDANNQLVKLDRKTVTVAAPTFDPAGGTVAAGTKVTITAAAGTTVYYTDNGDEPSDESTTYSAPIEITKTTTLKAIAIDGENNESTVTTATYTVEVAAPTFSHPAGAVEAGTTVSLSAPDADMIMYTTDGTDPDYDNNVGEVYDEAKPIEINAATTIKAIAIDAYDNVSAVATAAYTISVPDGPHYYQKVTATADITTGDYLIVYEDGSVAFNGGLDKLDASSNTISVTIDNDMIASAGVDGAIFTINTTAGTIQSKSGRYIGKTANSNGLDENESTAYTNTFAIDEDGNAVITSSGNCILRYNKASGQERFRYYKNGQEAIQLYKRVEGTMPVVVTVAAPTFNPAAGMVTSGTVVTISSEAGTSITYTTDGTDPQTSSTAEMTTENTATVTINATTTIRAIALDSDANESKEATATYTVEAVKVAVPTFNPEGGAVVAGTTVTISAPAAAFIMYTTDGTDPSYELDNGEMYSTPIAINAETTIKAIAVDDDGNESDVVTVTYTIKGTEPETAEGIVVWSEDWSSFADGDAPDNNGEFKYSYTNGGSTTKLWGEALAKGESPELLISKSNGNFVATIPLYGAYGDLTLTFQTNNALTSVKAKVDDDDNTTLKTPVAGENSIKISDVPEGAKQIVITFTNETSKNVRIDYFKLTAEKVAVTIGDYKYSTMYYGSSNLVVPEGVTVSTYKVEGDKLAESESFTEGDVLQKAQGYVLYSETPGSYTFAATDKTATTDADNCLHGFDTAAQTTGDGLFYLLGVSEGKVGFYWGATDGAAFKSGSHKAYLVAPTTSGVRAFYFDNPTTGVERIATESQLQGEAYDLQGRRVAQPRKGLYIVGGKKVMVK